MFSPLEQFDIISLFFFNIWIAYDLSLPNIMLPVIIIVFVLRSVYKNLYIQIHRILPKTAIQQLGEMVIVFIFNILKTNIGPSAYTNVCLWTATFLIVLLGNLLALIPYGIAMTSHIIITLWLSLGLTLGIFFRGIFSYDNFLYFKIFIPEAPLALLPILIAIELFSYIIRSFSLAIRLSANILAGHTLVYIIIGFLNMMLHLNTMFAVFTTVLVFLVYILELFVAILQAYVYISLITLYLKDTYELPSH